MTNTATSEQEDRRGSSAASYASPESASMSFRDSKIGFLGTTSYNAVFTENPGSLSVITEPHDEEDTPRLPPVAAERIEQSAEVLKLLRDMPIYQRFTQRWFELCDGIVVTQPALRIWIDELWSEFGELLQQGNPEQLRSMAELVWRNTRKPMKTHNQMTAREWANSASGRNLRWEVVGVILSIVGLVAANLSNWDSIFDSIREKFVDRATFAERMRKASEFCLCFCYESEVLNDLYVMFMYEELILVECLKGEAHYAAWQRNGEVCDAIIAMGLHQGNQVDAETPFFLSELRKKIFMSAYGHDKSIATFLGRPPRLSYRYCKMEVPLDLSDQQLFLEGPELEAALSTLDANGWSTTGNLSRTTWKRVWFQHCRIREDILEMALGSGDDDISQQAQQIRLKLERLDRSLPDFMRVLPEDLLANTDTYLGGTLNFGRSEMAMKQVNAMFLLCIHAGLVHTEFLLQRALINRTRTDTKELIPISRRMLRLVLLAQSRRDFFRDFVGDLVFLVSSVALHLLPASLSLTTLIKMAAHGLVAAAVLSIELLKQEQTRMYTPDILPRSETIQDLSVFVSSLAAVGPGEANFAICNQGCRALRKVLDQILSPSQPPLQGSSDPTSFDDMSLYFATGNDADFLQWLENVEWDKTNFMTPSASHEAS